VKARETAAQKARRLLLEGRLMVSRVDPELGSGLVIAECRGDSGEVYSLGHDPTKNEWRCTCPELRGNCSHLQALKLVVVI
jgi:hypothetical protein